MRTRWILAAHACVFMMKGVRLLSPPAAALAASALAQRRIYEQFCTEAASNVGDSSAPSRGMPSVLQCLPCPVDHLVRRPKLRCRLPKRRSKHAAPSWRGFGPGRVGFIELAGAAANALSKSPTRSSAGTCSRCCPRACIPACAARSNRQCSGYNRRESVRCGTSLLERLGHDDRDCLVVMLNFRSAEQIGVIHAPRRASHI